jgi:hypothetical protein
MVYSYCLLKTVCYVVVDNDAINPFLLVVICDEFCPSILLDRLQDKITDYFVLCMFV